MANFFILSADSQLESSDSRREKVSPKHKVKLLLFSHLPDLAYAICKSILKIYTCSFFLVILSSRFYINFLVHHYLKVIFWFSSFLIRLTWCLSYPLVLNSANSAVLLLNVFFLALFEQHLHCDFHYIINHFKNWKHAYFIILENFYYLYFYGDTDSFIFDII